MSKKCFTIFFLAFKFKNRREKDTFEAHGKSSKAEPLGNSSCERKVQGPSACHQCPLKALGGAGGRWHPGAVYFMVSLKCQREDPGDHISSYSLQQPYSLLASGHQEVEGQWTTVAALSRAWCFGYYSNFIFGNSPRSGRGFACGTLISSFSTSRSQTGSWSLAIQVDPAKIGWSQIWILRG